MVEVIQSEFERPETMTEVAKAQTQKEHDVVRSSRCTRSKIKT